MSIFTRLKKIRDFERVHLPHLRSLEDFDIVREIGSCQENGSRLTPKQLTLLGIAPPATIHRRLSRLVALGVVHKHSSQTDGRIIELSVSKDTAQVYEDIARLLRRKTTARAGDR